MAQPPHTRNAVLGLLAEKGPMTAAKITEELDFSRRAIDSAIHYARPDAKHPDRAKLIYIAGYERSLLTGGRLAPKYAAGGLPDAKEPARLSHKQRQKAFNKRHAVKLRIKARARRGKVNPWLAILAPDLKLTSKGGVAA